jgi:MHS family proline/betaine transporter-like MFS transporter
MILAVILYRPIYGEMFAMSDLTKKVELEDQRVVQRNSVISESDTLVTITQRKFYSDETVAVAITKQENHKVIAETKQEILLHGYNYWIMIALIVVQVILVTMVYGPIAAFLVELFPTRIRYTSMSLPYHIGNGIFGGLTPLIATYLAGITTDPLAGLWYPMGIAAITFVVGMIFLSNRKKAEVME